jgi:2-polyprenyl-3-methyl-5-hydroxy-6-metoxy-1,4-benzoquinol methylase
VAAGCALPHLTEGHLRTEQAGTYRRFCGADRTSGGRFPRRELGAVLTKVEPFGDQMVAILNMGMTANMMSVGHQVGLFDSMAAIGGHATSDQIAEAAGLDERYVREWLGAMATSGVVDYDGGKDGYLLPAEHAALTTRAAGPNNFASFTQLGSGIRVADVRTGSGHAINVMAQAFPESAFVGFDISEEALTVGRAEAQELGLSNSEFLVHDAANIADVGRFDLVTTFDAVHDQVDPVGMVQAVFDMLKPGGYWLCVDIQASSHVGENIDHPMGTFFYSVSCAHCMTVSLAHDGAGLGAMWGVQTARKMFTDAGFVDLEIHNVEGDISNNY